MLSYPFALKAASSRRTGVAEGESNSEKIPVEAFEISERLRKVDIVAQESHGELSSFDMSLNNLSKFQIRLNSDELLVTSRGRTHQ